VKQHKICGFNIYFDRENYWETDGIIFGIFDIYIGLFVHKRVEWNNLNCDW